MEMPLRKTTESFIAEANKKHDFKYDYSLVDYKGCLTNIDIICKIHGVFSQKPAYHLFKNGCKKCNKLLSKKESEKMLNKFLEKAPKIHNNKYDYSKSVYYGSQKLMLIICPIHGEFQQQPNSHLNGNGCQSCARDLSSFGKNGFLNFAKGISIFYIIRCWNENEEFYKIGVTSKKSIEKRYCNSVKFPYKYQIIKEVKDTPQNIWDLERKMLKELKNFKYRPKISFKGITECFTNEIKNLI